MAKKSIVQRNLKRQRLSARYSAKRAELKKILSDPSTSDEAFFEAQTNLARLPRNASPTRVGKRCLITGRSRGVMRRFGISRITFRELASQGLIPGVVKSSW